MTIVVSDSAAKHITAMQIKMQKPALMLRVTVLGGGCSGFKYTLAFDEQKNADDVTFEKNGAMVVTDETSLPFLADAIVDYEQTLMSSAFKIRNPNASSSCGCGKSFALKN
jgi:iron-sulfur cluster insertion protein